MEIVDHDALWRVSLDEVRRRGALAPNCSVIECDEHIVRKLASCKHTARLRLGDWVESGRLFVEMLLMAAAAAEMECVRDDNKNRCFIASDFDTMLTSTAESSDNDKTNELPEHCTLTSGMRVGGCLSRCR